MSDLAKKIMITIEEEHVTPVPAWRFTAKNFIFWLTWVTSILIGAAAVAALLFTLSNAGWKYYAATHNTFLTFFVESIPYLWLIATVLFTILSFQNFRHTRKGYTFRATSVIFLSLTLSIACGALLYQFGLGYTVDTYVSSAIPFHDSVEGHQKVLWQNPEKGLVAGTVEEIDNEGAWFTLNSFDGDTWTIYTSELRERDLVSLAEFSDIRILGVVEGDVSSHEMTGCIVIPWLIHGKAGQSEFTIEHPAPPIPVPCKKDECEINFEELRSTKCKDVRPYTKLINLNY